jgi:cytidine deaminase
MKPEKVWMGRESFTSNHCTMEWISEEFRYKKYSGLEELTAEDQELMSAAIIQLENAYAPYSGFQVGAAVRLADRAVFLGSNQENASYPLCMCAERVALYNAAVYRKDIPVESLAITVKNIRKPVMRPVSPCGACRQVISEYETRHQHPIRILLKSDAPEIYEITSVGDILPLGFNGSFLSLEP